MHSIFILRDPDIVICIIHWQQETPWPCWFIKRRNHL